MLYTSQRTHGASANIVIDGAIEADNTVAERFVNALTHEALSHRAVNHPYLQALAEATLPDMRGALTDFARVYYGYSAHFPRYLTATISRLEQSPHRTALIENLTEESGQYHEPELQHLESIGILREWIVAVPHPELFRHFREALGVHGDDGLNDIDAVCWREMFYSVIVHGSAAEAIGALGLGTETIVSAMYAHLTRALRPLALPAQATVFFPLHCDVDDAHQESLRRIAIDLAVTAEGRDGLKCGMRKALVLRAGFWDQMLERALSAAPGQAQ